NHFKTVVYDCSLFPWLVSFVLVGKLVSVGAVFWTSILAWALKILRVASINFRASRRLGRLAQSEI
ncbi:hypothetical protein ACM6XL_004432, partial [Vibrio vulnificus]